jgi:protoheme IX farnesyltransferase
MDRDLVVKCRLLVLLHSGQNAIYTINPKSAMFEDCYFDVQHDTIEVWNIHRFCRCFSGLQFLFMLGWVAATGNFGVKGHCFSFSFLAIPSFSWKAIGWFCYELRSFCSCIVNHRDSLQIIASLMWLIIAAMWLLIRLCQDVSILSKLNWRF